MIIAETPRIILRQFQWEDFDAVAAMKADPQVMRYIGNGEPATPEQVKTMITRWLNNALYAWSENTLKEVPQLYRAVEKKAHFSAWAMELKTTGEFVGRCGLAAWNLDGDLEVEIGYVLARRFWGKGLATEAALASRDYGFDRLGFDRLISIIQPGNLPSQNVARRVGMHHEKMRDVRGTNCMIFSITRDGPPQSP
jgi:[ribosomal protein S5]-alanine N-acetyltransferase